MVLPPFNSTRSNCSAIWEFWPNWLGWTAITWPTSFDPLGMSVSPGAINLGHFELHRAPWVRTLSGTAI
jgi:hypothetical protein